MKMTVQTWMLGLLVITGCSTSSNPTPGNGGIREPSAGSVVYEGPELIAAIGFHHASEAIGGEWLILATQFTSPRSDGGTTIRRTDISLRTPEGGRLIPMDQEEFRENYGRFRIPLQRALSYLPILRHTPQSQIPCTRWFVEEPGGGPGQDEILVNARQLCSGPLVFKVAGGVQPGRWRLVIELEESTADLPFLVEHER